MTESAVYAGIACLTFALSFLAALDALRAGRAGGWHAKSGHTIRGFVSLAFALLLAAWSITFLLLVQIVRA